MHPLFLPRLVAAGLILLALALGGCGVFHADAAIGPDLKPRLGSSVSLPFGK